MPSPNRLIAYYFRDVGLATDPVDRRKWPSYIGFEPAAPDETITIYAPMGSVDARIHRTGEKPNHPGIQVRVRAAKFETAYDKAEELQAALDAIKRTQVTIANVVYVIQSFMRTAPIVHIGREEDQPFRELVVINGRMTINP